MENIPEEYGSNLRLGGLKTRGWQETEPALRNMAAAAKEVTERGGVWKTSV